MQMHTYRKKNLNKGDESTKRLDHKLVSQSSNGSSIDFPYVDHVFIK